MRKGGCPSLGGLGKCFLWGEGSLLGLEKWVEFDRAERTGEEEGLVWTQRGQWMSLE